MSFLKLLSLSPWVKTLFNAVYSVLNGRNQLAASLKSSGDALSGVASASKDEQTKLSGNDAAHQAIDTAKTKAEEIAAAIESIGTNLQTVANGFTAVDEATAASMQ